VVQPLKIEIGAGPYVVLAFLPVDVDDRLVLVVVADVRHIELRDADVLIRVEVEDRHAPFEVPSSIESGDPEELLPFVLSDVGMLDRDGLPDVAEVRIRDDSGAEGVRGAR
jgi:hypothetical protein